MTKRIESYSVNPISPPQRIQNEDNPERRREEIARMVKDELEKKATEKNKGNNIDITI